MSYFFPHQYWRQRKKKITGTCNFYKTKIRFGGWCTNGNVQGVQCLYFSFLGQLWWEGERGGSHRKRLERTAQVSGAPDGNVAVPSSLKALLPVPISLERGERLHLSDGDGTWPTWADSCTEELTSAQQGEKWRNCKCGSIVSHWGALKNLLASSLAPESQAGKGMLWAALRERRHRPNCAAMSVLGGAWAGCRARTEEGRLLSLL